MVHIASRERRILDQDIDCFLEQRIEFFAENTGFFASIIALEAVGI
jgi:hypothetical protein